MANHQMRSILFTAFFLQIWACALEAQSPRLLKPGQTFDSTITPTTPHDYSIKLSRGESVNLAVEQKGVDLALELRAPNQTLLGVFDSPNGRNGPEPLEIIATQSGAYRLRVRTFDANEPRGLYTLAVKAWRNANETRSLLETRRLARKAASAWLAQRTASIPANAVIPANAELASLDSMASRARIFGIGEATHGSREFGSLRISLTKRLIERHGFRIVAIEASSARLSLLNAYISGASQTNKGGPGDFQWIGAASRRELVPFLREWNDTHATDKVLLVGVDPQDNAFARDSLRAFLLRAYGEEVVTRLAPMFSEFAAADSQVMVFGNSDVDSVSRQTILAVNAMLDLDAPMLSQRFGSESVASARMIARDLAQVADFNGGGPPVSHSRDFYMAANILSEMQQFGPRAKTIFWAHNAHVSHPSGQSESGRSSGAWLRTLLV
jgi:erythromycin esterase